MLSPMGPVAGVQGGRRVRMRGLMMGGWFVATAVGNKADGHRRLLRAVAAIDVLHHPGGHGPGDGGSSC